MADKRYPMTQEQRQLLQQDIAEAKTKLEEIASLVRTCCGDETEPGIRAAEMLAALQRLQWAIERAETESASVRDFLGLQNRP